MNELEVIELSIDDLELDRVEAIALVDNPAIQRNWLAFNSQEFIKPESGQSEQDWMGVCVPHYIKKGDAQDQAVAKCLSIYSQHMSSHKFQTHDAEKRIVAGPLMVADMPIYRNMDGKEFFVKFSAATIEAIVNKFMKEGRINAFNFMHDETKPIKDVYIQQSFIIDSTKGVNTPNGFEPLPDGSWFGYIKVDNEQIWNDFVKTGQLNGFSVEGQFSQKNKFNNNIMSKVEEFLKKLETKFFGEPDANTTETVVEMTSAKLADGTEIKYDGQLAQGTAVMGADGNPLADGEYTLEDGTVFAIMGGVVEEIKTPMQPDMNAAMAAEIEALKLENENLKKQISESVTKTEMSSAISDVVATQKELFEAIKLMNEKEQPENKKDEFRAAETNFNTRMGVLSGILSKKIK